MKKSILYSLAVIFIATLLLFGLKNSEPIQAFATSIMSRESFLAMTPYGVAEAHDTETTLRKAPAIYWGYDSDGSVTISAGTYQYAFNTSCDPRIILTPVTSVTDALLYSAHVTEYTTSSTFKYIVQSQTGSTTTDVTSSIPVFWVAFGWR